MSKDRVSAWVDKETKRKLKIACAQRDMTESAIVLRAIQTFLAGDVKFNSFPQNLLSGDSAPQNLGPIISSLKDAADELRNAINDLQEAEDRRTQGEGAVVSEHGGKASAEVGGARTRTSQGKTTTHR